MSISQKGGPASGPASPAQVERGVGIARRQGELRWEWGDLALEVVPPSEKGQSSGQAAAFRGFLGQLSTNPDVRISELPSEASLTDYRDAAASLPPEAREGVGVYSAVELARHEPDKAKRLAIVERLRAEHSRGMVTVDAVRVLSGKAGTRGSDRTQARLAIERMHPAEQLDVARELLSEPRRVREIADDIFDQKTAAGRVLTQEAVRRDHERRMGPIRVEPLPERLETLTMRIVSEVRSWTTTLTDLEEDFAGLRPSWQSGRLARALRSQGEVALRVADRVPTPPMGEQEPPTSEDDDVIQGEASEVRPIMGELRAGKLRNAV